MTVPGNLSSPLLATAADAAAAPGVRSLRFNAGDTAYLSRTPSSAGNRKTFTFACWFKLVETSGTRRYLFSAASANTGSPYNWILGFAVLNGQLCYTNAANDIYKTDAVLRDFSAWYHCVFAVDTTQATTSDRVKIYLNGALMDITDQNHGGADPPSQNTEYPINNTTAHAIGAVWNHQNTDLSGYFNGYIADAYLIDGLQLTPTSFGSYDSNGVWQRGTYSGTFGTNGFHCLDFENEATIGDDSSGNSNDFTANNLSDTAGVGNDVLLDFPANGSESDTGLGGEVSGNYAVINALNAGSNSSLTDGNLKWTRTSNGYSMGLATIGVSSGKWYYEHTFTGSQNNAIAAGIVPVDDTSSYPGQNSNSVGYNFNGTKVIGTTQTSYGATYDDGDVIGVAFDADNGTVVFYKNGVSQGTATSSLSSGPYTAAVSAWGSGTGSIMNFGQRAFAYSAPSGYKALCTTNLPTPTIADGSDYFEAKLYSDAPSSVSGLSFSPDFVWLKRRSAAADHGLYDIVRGANKLLYSNATNSEETSAGVSAFNSDGFDLGSNALFKGSGNTFVAWCWDAGSSTVSNTDGSITSSVRANPTAGFSVVTFTQSGSSGDIPTVGHGLNAAPEMIFLKSRSNAQDWRVFHTANGVNKTISLNSTGAAGTVGSPPAWSVSGSTFGAKNGQIVDSGYTYVAYCFAPVAGYSAFGSYTGNGSTDGPFIYTGFRPRWIMIKRFTDGAENWRIVDTARDTYNLADAEIYANSSGAELSSDLCDILSNGFKIRVSFSGSNTSSKEYLYVAFAENPFQANGGLAR